MARFPKKKGSNEEKIFFSDNLTQADKDRVNKQLKEKPVDVPDCLQKLFDHGLVVKIAWSEYNDSYSATVSPLDKDLPYSGTFYSTFHAEWSKALYILVFLLGDRYHFGDWAKDGLKKYDNAW